MYITKKKKLFMRKIIETYLSNFVKEPDVVVVDAAAAVGQRLLFVAPAQIPDNQ